jgi:hypothetical protein
MAGEQDWKFCDVLDVYLVISCYPYIRKQELTIDPLHLDVRFLYHTLCAL